MLFEAEIKYTVLVQLFKTCHEMK